jgi:hypothetical protein
MLPLGRGRVSGIASLLRSVVLGNVAGQLTSPWRRWHLISRLAGAAFHWKISAMRLAISEFRFVWDR